MKYRKSKKAALLLTMIIGAQLVGSKEVLAVQQNVIGHGNPIDVGARPNLIEHIPQIEHAGSSTSGDDTNNGEDNLDGKIYKMIDEVCKDLSTEQRQSAMLERYVPELRGIKEFKLLMMKMDSLINDLVVQNNDDMIEKVKDEDKKDVKDMIEDLEGGETRKKLRALKRNLSIEIEEAVNDPEFKKIYERIVNKKGNRQKALNDYIKKKFMNDQMPGKKFIDETNRTMKKFLLIIEDRTSTVGIKKGIVLIANYYGHFYRRKKILTGLLDISDVKKPIKLKQQIFKKFTDTRVSKLKTSYQKIVKKIIEDGEIHDKVAQIRTFLDDARFLKPAESFDQDADIEIQKVDLDKIDLDQWGELDQMRQDLEPVQTVLHEMEYAIMIGYIFIKHCDSKDHVKVSYEKERLILKKILRHEEFAKGSKLYKKIRFPGTANNKSWLEIARKKCMEEVYNERRRLKMIETIKKKLVRDLIDDVEVLERDGRENGINNMKKLQRLIFGEMWKEKRQSFEQFGIREKFRKMIKNWNAKISIPMGIVEFSEEDLKKEKAKLQDIVDRIKRQS